jgi:hypothetical protein
VATRKEQKEALRRERLEREQAAAAAQRRKRLVGYGVGGGLALAALVAVAVVIAAGGGGGSGGSGFPDGSVPDQKVADLEPAARAAGCRLINPRDEGRGHVSEPVTYNTDPPASGNHNPIPGEDGAYYDDAPSIEALVHSLEHGRIVIWFKPSLPSGEKGSLKALFDEDPPGMIIAPEDTMPYEVAASAWTHIVACPEMNPRVFDAIRTFKERYRGRGPEQVGF